MIALNERNALVSVLFSVVTAAIFISAAISPLPIA